MDLFIAAASGPPVGALALLTLLAAGGYTVAAAVWPFAAHGRCKGTGKLRSPSGRAWRTCRGCKGTGRKLRYGRRAYEALRSKPSKPSKP